MKSGLARGKIIQSVWLSSYKGKANGSVLCLTRQGETSQWELCRRDRFSPKKTQGRERKGIRGQGRDESEKENSGDWGCIMDEIWKDRGGRRAGGGGVDIFREMSDFRVTISALDGFLGSSFFSPLRECVRGWVQHHVCAYRTFNVLSTV